MSETSDKAKEIAMSILAPSAQKTKPTPHECVWTKWTNDDEKGTAYWETSCGEVSEGFQGVLDDDFNYCNKCGKPIRENTKEYEREQWEAEQDWDEARMEVIRREWGYVGR